MCGLAGIGMCERQRNKTEIDRIRRLFTRLLVESEHRGPYATGVAVIGADGTCRVHKAPVMASGFVSTHGYRDAMASVNSGTTIIMGHTRWPTRGSHLDNRNNQPLSGRCVVAHNGHIRNADEVSDLLGLSRLWEVDSEALLRIADRNLVNNGLDVSGLRDDLRYLSGRLSAVIADPRNPDTIYLIKGNQPLFLRWYQTLGILVYASEEEIIDRAMNGTVPSRDIPIPAWTVVTLKLEQEPELSFEPFAIKGGDDHGADYRHRDR